MFGRVRGSLALCIAAGGSSPSAAAAHPNANTFQFHNCCFALPVSERTAAGLFYSRNLSLLSRGRIWISSKRGITMSTNGNGSLCRQNWHEECEGHVNRQINMELYASYVYMSMAWYFDRDDVAFPGLHKYFKKQSDEEREHAQLFMKYQNQRGGRIMLQPVAKPSNDEWNSPLEALTAALELEKSVNTNLLKIHGVAGANNDPQLCDFLETHFLEEQIESMKEISEFIVQLKRCGSGIGEYIFDKELANKP